MRRQIIISVPLFLLASLAACSSKPGSAPTPVAERSYDCTDVNGPIGTLRLTGDGQALVVEPDASKQEALGPYTERDGKLIIHNPDFGDMIYTVNGDKLANVAPPDSSLAADHIACQRKAS